MMTTKESLIAEKDSLELKIKANEALIKSLQDTIYWDRKRVKLIEKQLKVTPDQPVAVG